MMTCAGLLAVATVILLVGSLLILALIPTAFAVFLLAIVLTILGLILTWRYIYPWLVRMGRWAAQVRNIIFLFIVVAAVELFLRYVVCRAGICIPAFPIMGIQITVIGLALLGLALFLLSLAVVVWLVRAWRYTWPTSRDFFWDLWFRMVALFWKIVAGIPLGITWFLYHPPLRWFAAAFLFYFRGIAAAAAWLLYNPPLRSILKAVFVIFRLIGRIVAFFLYNPPIGWLIMFGVFLIRLVVRPISTVIYWIYSWWPITGVKGTLTKGITTEARSYHDYKYA